MNIENNIRTVKDFFAAIGRGDREGMLALAAEDIEWIIPGEDWPLAGTHRGHAGLTDFLETASRSMETSTEPREFVAQGDRVLVVGFATGKVKATNKAFEGHFVFAITVRDGKLTNIRGHAGARAGFRDGCVWSGVALPSAVIGSSRIAPSPGGARHKHPASNGGRYVRPDKISRVDPVRTR